MELFFIIFGCMVLIVLIAAVAGKSRVPDRDNGRSPEYYDDI